MNENFNLMSILKFLLLFHFPFCVSCAILALFVTHWLAFCPKKSKESPAGCYLKTVPSGFEFSFDKFSSRASVSTPTESPLAFIFAENAKLLSALASVFLSSFGFLFSSSSSEDKAPKTSSNETYGKKINFHFFIPRKVDFENPLVNFFEILKHTSKLFFQRKY